MLKHEFHLPHAHVHDERPLALVAPRGQRRQDFSRRDAGDVRRHRGIEVTQPCRELGQRDAHGPGDDAGGSLRGAPFSSSRVSSRSRTSASRLNVADISFVATEIAADAGLLCFDELSVTDIDGRHM